MQGLDRTDDLIYIKLVIMEILALANYFVVLKMGAGAKLTKRKLNYLLIFLICVSDYLVAVFLSDYDSPLLLLHTLLYSFFVVALLTEKFGWRQFALAVWINLSTTVILFIVQAMIYATKNKKLTAAYNGDTLLADFLAVVVWILFFYGSYRKKIYILQRAKTRYLVIFTFYSLVSAFFIFVFERGLNFGELSDRVAFILYQFINLLIMYFILSMSYANEILKDNDKLLRENQKLQEDYFVNLKDSNEHIRHMRHDMKAHFTVIRNMAERGNTEEISKYIDEITEEGQALEGMIDVKNSIANTIINHYDELIKNAGGTLKVSGSLPLECHIDRVDIVIIFSNLLSNACEALEKIRDGKNLINSESDNNLSSITAERDTNQMNNESDNKLINTEEYNETQTLCVTTTKSKEVNLEIRSDETNIFIVQRNPFEGKLVKKNGSLISSKDDALNHGIGLENIRLAAEKYDGEMETEALDDIFITKVRLKNM